MQFTKAEGYGIFGLLYLADRADGDIVPLSEISESQVVPEKFLAKIFQSLSKSGLIRSHRGVKGGFTLSKPANQITVREVLESIQGPYFIAKCLNADDACDRKVCALKVMLKKVQDAMFEVFNSYTLAELLEWQKTLERAKTV
jgi:Rrf2 family iron-sulfur cluster assembly transcriptional regulator